MDQKAKCPFCDYSGPSEILHQNDHAFAIEPIDPVVPGHLLVIPWRHVNDFIDLTGRGGRRTVPETFEFAQKVARWEEEKNKGYLDWNLITSKGEAATQTVFHFHIHLVPRRYGDGLELPWS